MTLLTRRLLKWFKKFGRTLPWRGAKDPYKIWISEIMLQQTQVETVKAYYTRWLQKFPKVESVASATEEEALKAWEGLGYYARARNFQKACRMVCNEFQGKIPSDPNQLEKLPGIGPYTKAAIASMAYRKPLACMDGNIKRIVCRLLAIEHPPSHRLLAIENFLNQHLPKTRPGDFNEALMDLGSMICTPQNPKCLVCPIHTYCKAYEQKIQDRLPVKEKKMKRPHYLISVGVIWKGNKILISRRKSKGLLGGLWEFPGGKIEALETPQACAKREIKEELGVEVSIGEQFGKVKHAFTHFSIEMHAFHCRYVSGKPKTLGCSDWRWVQLSQIPELAFPKANHKLFELLPRQNPFLKSNQKMIL